MPRTTPAWTRCARLATLAAALAAAPLLAHSQNVMYTRSVSRMPKPAPSTCLLEQLAR